MSAVINLLPNLGSVGSQGRMHGSGTDRRRAKLGRKPSSLTNCLLEFLGTTLLSCLLTLWQHSQRLALQWSGTLLFTSREGCCLAAVAWAVPIGMQSARLRCSHCCAVGAGSYASSVYTVSRGHGCREGTALFTGTEGTVLMQ